jgi:hypothetical protein
MVSNLTRDFFINRTPGDERENGTANVSIRSKPPSRHGECRGRRQTPARRSLPRFLPPALQTAPQRQFAGFFTTPGE